MGSKPIQIGLRLLLAALVTLPGYAAKTDEAHLEDIQSKHEVDRAIAKGLAYLVSKQDEVQGHFGSNMPNAYTALSSIALMAAGQIPGQSKYGDNLQRGIMYLVRKSNEYDGYLGKEGNARMYGHGICTLALCEAYGMMESEEDNRKIKEAIEDALKVIIDSQAPKDIHRGGWRYEPKKGDADLSVTVWQMLVLRSAKNCQFEVPDKTIAEARDYVLRSFRQDKKGFAYQPNHGNDGPAMRAAGVVALLALGEQNDPSIREKIDESGKFLKSHNPNQGSHFWYMSYYLATAANMMGEETRESFLPRQEKVLMDMQQDSGEFHKHSGHAGGVYSTAFGVICLSVHYQYLPIYQE